MMKHKLANSKGESFFKAKHNPNPICGVSREALPEGLSLCLIKKDVIFLELFQFDEESFIVFIFRTITDLWSIVNNRHVFIIFSFCNRSLFLPT